MLPAEAAEVLDLDATTPAQFVIAGTDIGRRNIKRWSPRSDRWFVDLTEAQCRKAGVDTGDRARIEITRLADELPEELQVLLEEGKKAAWAKLTPARRRALADHVRGAKRAQTRQRRAAAILEALPAE